MFKIANIESIDQIQYNRKTYIERDMRRCLKFIREVEYVTKYKGIIYGNYYAYFLGCESRRVRFLLQHQTFACALHKISSCKCVLCVLFTWNLIPEKSSSPFFNRNCLNNQFYCKIRKSTSVLPKSWVEWIFPFNPNSTYVHQHHPINKI